MTAVAIVRVHGEHEPFVAELCDLDAGCITAEGRWRTEVGPTTGSPLGERRRYTWPLASVRQVRWLEAGKEEQ